MSLVLGIDSSTQSCSALVLDLQRSAIVAESSVVFGEQLPQYGAANGFVRGDREGEVFANPLMWLDALELLLSDLCDKIDLSAIAAVCGAGQQHGSVYLNGSWLERVGHLSPGQSLAEQLAPCLSRPLSPIWMDHSTSVECAEITAAMGGRAALSERSGSVAIERFTGPQIRRFHKLQPEAYANTRRIHLVSSFLASVIAGVDAPIDTGDGAGMNLLNINKRNWDPLLLQATAPDLADKLPPVVRGNQQIGCVSAYFQKRFGFSPAVPVVVFTGDNPASLVGMGAGQIGQVVISLGTSDTFFAAMPAVQADHSGCGHVFGNPLGGTLSLQCFSNGSLAREAVRNRFDMDWQAFSAALQSTPPGNKGRLMLPLFTPEISPRIHRNEPILEGDSDFVQGKEPAAWVRACVEGQFINMCLQTRWMRLKPKRILLTGGAARNDAIAQVVADVFQCQVERLRIGNSVALGSAMRAAIVPGLAELNELEATFCKVEPGKGKSPHPGCAETYAHMANRMEKLINASRRGL
jgi:xylulokinase